MLPRVDVELPAGEEHHHCGEQPERVAQARVALDEEHIDDHDHCRKENGHDGAAFGLQEVLRTHFLNVLCHIVLRTGLLLKNNKFVTSFLHSFGHFVGRYAGGVVSHLRFQTSKVAHCILHTLHIFEGAFGVHGAVCTHQSFYRECLSFYHL